MLFDPTIIALAQQCSPNVEAHSMATLVHTESSNNPFNIGVVGATLAVAPKTKEEAIQTATTLLKSGANFSVGLGQLNIHNLEPLGISLADAFDPCTNLRGAATILTACYTRAVAESGEGQPALQKAYSCYYSNNFNRGFESDGGTKGSYVLRIAKNNEKLLQVPGIEFKPEDVPVREKATDQQPALPKTSTKALEDLSVPKEQQAESWDVMKDFTQP